MAENISTEPLRLFVAVTVPDVIRNEMMRLQDRLRLLVPRGAVRWTRPEQFHLTLRFLGDVSSGCVSDLQKAVGEVCAEAPALQLCAQGIGFFPNARSPRVIWIGIGDHDHRLADLQQKIESAVRPFTREQGNERFAGHVTLGRFKQFNRLEIRELTSDVETLKDRVFGEWAVIKVEIIRSELMATGSRYTVLADFPLDKKIESV